MDDARLADLDRRVAEHLVAENANRLRTLSITT
jgi:hypothetical protein